MLTVIVALSALALPPQEPLKLGVIARLERGQPELAYGRGATFAVTAINRAGGVDGAKVELVVEPAESAAAVAAAVEKLQAAGVHALLPPLEAGIARAAAKAAGELPMPRYAIPVPAMMGAIDALLAERLCMTKVGLVRGRKRPDRTFAKTFGETLTAPTRLLWDIDVRTSPRKFSKTWTESRPEVLVFDVPPADVQSFLAAHIGDDPIPMVLTPRAWSSALLPEAKKRATFVVHGTSPAQSATESELREVYERDFGTPGFGAAEGFEAVTALARAFDAANGRDAAAVTAALQGSAIEGVRGRLPWDQDSKAFLAPVGIWLVDEDSVLRPYAPRIVPREQKGTAVGGEVVPERAVPQAGIGVPFGAWRTRRFGLDEGAQWVICEWADDGGYATATEDLVQLGLSTGGKSPIVDHLVKEEIFARVLAITSTKFGRKKDGSAVPGKSLNICFGVYADPKARKKKRQRLWPARFGGDHEGAGGEAFGTFCRVYTAFIRRTIFQSHALEPAVSAADREFLDGSYRFGDDLEKDRRSELIRALINGYAGSMALTLAHEVGHLGTLGHVTEPPTAIMNVDEGGGIDYPEAKFCESSWAILVEQLGLVGTTAGTSKKKRGRNRE